MSKTIAISLLLLMGVLAPSAVAANATTATTTLETLDRKLDALAARAGLDAQVAVLTAVPIQSTCSRTSTTARWRCASRLYSLGHTIEGLNWPASPIRNHPGFRNPSLPSGTYLIELQQPYSDNIACQGSVARTQLLNLKTGLFRRGCPQLILAPAGMVPTRLADGFGVFTSIPGRGLFLPQFVFPVGHAFTEERPADAYGGSIKITRLR